jgi:hypothetical protein
MPNDRSARSQSLIAFGTAKSIVHPRNGLLQRASSGVAAQRRRLKLTFRSSEYEKFIPGQLQDKAEGTLVS